MGGQWWYEAFLYVISYASHQCINIHRRTVRVNWNTLECMFCPTLHPGWIWSDSCSRQLKKLKDKGMVTMIASVCHVRGHTPFFFAKLWQKHSNICCNVYCSIYRSRNTKKGIENVTWDLDISCFLIFYVLDSAQRDRIWFSNVFSPIQILDSGPDQDCIWRSDLSYLYFSVMGLLSCSMSHIFECSTTASGTVWREASGCFHGGR